MSLIERKYMSESYNKELLSQEEYEKKDKQTRELLRLYDKDKKSILDKWKINKLKKSIAKYYK